MIHTICLFLAFTGAIPKPANMQAQEKWENIEYANLSPEETLSIYTPGNENGDKLPALIIIGNDPEWKDTMMNNALKRGFAAVTVNYRNTVAHPFPAQIQDINAALKWLRGYGRKYNISPEKFVLCGAGEGGYLAALAAVSESYIDGVMAQIEFGGGQTAVNAQNNEQQNQYWIELFNIFPGGGSKTERQLSGKHPKVAGVIDFYGYTRNPGKIMITNADLNMHRIDNQTSVATYVTPCTPPFLMIYGEKDNIVPVQQAEELYKIIKKNLCPPGRDNCPTDMIIIPEAGHGGEKFTSAGIINKIFDYIKNLF